MKRVFAAQLRSRNLFRLLALSGIMLFISGCLQIDYDITFNHDGSESVIAKIAAIKELNNQITKMDAKMKARGYKTSIETRNDSVFLTATQTFAAGKWVLPHPNGMIKDSVQLTQSYVDYFFFKKYMLNAKYSFNNNDTSYDANLSDFDNMLKDSSSKNKDSQATPDSDGQLFSIPVTYHIHVPGKIDTTTSTNVIMNTMTWKYKLENGVKVNVGFASTELNYTYLIILGILIAAVVFYFAMKLR